jgi:hypothetical protein
MKLPKIIYELREHGDGKAISVISGIPPQTISDVFQLGEGSPKVVNAIKKYYNIN